MHLGTRSYWRGLGRRSCIRLLPPFNRSASEARGSDATDSTAAVHHDVNA